MPHPLDRPVWSALTTRQAALALGDARAVRLDPAYGPFAAAADASPGSLCALAALITDDHPTLALIQAEPTPAPPGTIITLLGVLHQMIATRLTPLACSAPIVPLTEADAPDMLALATLTEPGPFAARTHQLGDFVGVKQDGRLVAMAGERMQPDGFTELSAVCTHPEHRGRGYAGALITEVTRRILARGETAFLHVYPGNTGAIALYETLGFTLRRPIGLTLLTGLPA